MRSVLYFNRNSLYYYGGNIGKPISLAIPNTILQDIEVIDAVAFKKLLLQFFKKYTIKPTSIMICFSSQSYFLKQLQSQKEALNISLLLSDFTEIVPFDHVLTKLFTFQKKQAIIALNKDIAYLIRDALEPFGFKIEGIIPLYVLVGERDQPFSLQLAQLIIKHFSSLHEIGFPVHETKPLAIEADDNEFYSKDNESEHRNARLYIMIGILAILIVVLIYIFFFYKKTPTQKKTTQPTPTQQRRITPSPPHALSKNSPTPTAKEEQIITTKKKEELTIQIVNGSGIVGQAGKLQKELEDVGFKNISLGNAPTQSADNILVVVKSNISQPIKREIQDVLTGEGFTSRIRINNDIKFDILITTYQITPSTNH